VKITNRKVPVAVLLFAVAAVPTYAAEKIPAVGDTAKDFELANLDGKKIKLSTLTDSGPVVLVVLRGWPGYQCPICSRQFGEFLGKADELKKAGAKAAFVYPGPPDALTTHAKDFFKNRTIPENFTLFVDPDYTFTNAYGLRWDARAETAYPSTFVLDSKRKVLFAKTSKTHGNRAKIADVLKALPPK
jgi:peroxiredoxin